MNRKLYLTENLLTNGETYSYASAAGYCTATTPDLTQTTTARLMAKFRRSPALMN